MGAENNDNQIAHLISCKPRGCFTRSPTNRTIGHAPWTWTSSASSASSFCRQFINIAQLFGIKMSTRRARQRPYAMHNREGTQCAAGCHTSEPQPPNWVATGQSPNPVILPPPEEMSFFAHSQWPAQIIHSYIAVCVDLCCNGRNSKEFFVCCSWRVPPTTSSCGPFPSPSAPVCCLAIPSVKCFASICRPAKAKKVNEVNEASAAQLGSE